MLYDSEDPYDIWTGGRFEFAFRYPYSSGWRPLLWSALAVLLSFLVLPLLILLGYLYRVARSAARGELRAAGFSGVLGLAYDGLRVTLLVLAYNALLLAALVASGIAVESGNAGPADALVTLALLSFVVVWLYLFSAVLTVFAATGSVLRTLLSTAVPRFGFSRSYLYAWLLQIPLIVMLHVVGLLMALTLVGLLFWVPLFYLVLGSYWGRVYFDGVESTGWTKSEAIS